MTPSVGTTSLLDECESIWAATQKAEAFEKCLGQVPDIVRLWDGEWMLHHLLTYENSSSYEWADGDIANGRFEVDTDSPAGQWLMDMQARIDRGEKRNVHLTVDIASGQRMGYRMEIATQEDREDGTSVVVAEFKSDHAELAYRYIKPNSFLPAIFQFPRLFILPGPVPWISSVALFLDIWREHFPLLTFPDDPLSLDWLTSLDMSTWSVVVKPCSFIDSINNGSVWGILISRWSNYHDKCKPMWNDAQITPVLRRYLAGDPPPWPGANLRHGTLVVSFEDNSGSWTGTAHGGTIIDGLLRTFIDPVNDFIESSLSPITDGTIPAEYFDPNACWLTRKELPYCVYFAGENTGIEFFKHATRPGTAVNLSTGGHSIPGANELISLGIQALFDVIGNAVQIGSIGGSVDAVLKPLYEDTVAAWIEVKLHLKAQDQGWSRYWESAIASSGKAYTLDSVMVLRSGVWETRPFEAVSLKVRDGHPFVVGRHFWIGHRICATKRHDPYGRLYVEQVKKLTRTNNRDDFQKWEVEMGQPDLNDPAAGIYKQIGDLVNSARELGVA